MPLRYMNTGADGEADRLLSEFEPSEYTRTTTTGQSELDEHLASHLKGIDDYLGTTGGFGGPTTASELPSTPTGDVAATDVQAAIAELDTEKVGTSHDHTGGAGAQIPTAGLVTGAVTTAKLNDGAVTTVKITDAAVTNAKLSSMAQSTIKGREAGSGTGAPVNLTATQVRSIINVENGATADQTDAEIETAYNNQVPAVTQATAEAGTDTTVRRWTAQRVAQAIAALETGGGGLTRYLVPNRFYFPEIFVSRGVLGTSASGVTAGNGTIIYLYCEVPAGENITDLHIQVATATAGGTCRLAVYDDDGTGEPDALLDESSTLDCSTTGIKSFTLSDGGTTLAGDGCWVAMRSSNSSIQYRYIDGASAGTYMGQTNGASNLGLTITGLTESGSYDTFPANAGTLSPAVTSVPLLAFEVS